MNSIPQVQIVYPNCKFCRMPFRAEVADKAAPPTVCKKCKEGK